MLQGRSQLQLGLSTEINRINYIEMEVAKLIARCSFLKEQLVMRQVTLVLRAVFIERSFRNISFTETSERRVLQADYPRKQNFQLKIGNSIDHAQKIEQTDHL